jgi:hypothetical protein
MTASAIPCASFCTQRDRHLSDCPCADPNHEHDAALDGLCTCGIELDDADPYCVQHRALCPNCTGCLPRLAAPGLQVCPGCERAAGEALAELPDLWVDLAERPRLAGVSKAPTTEGDTPDPMGDARRDARSAIKAALVFWCVILEETHSITVPDETRIAQTTRSIAAWHSDMSRRSRENGQAEEAHRHAVAAAAARDDRETGRDILRAICEHITRHLDTLLAGDDAEQLVSQVKGARHGARGLAFASRGAAVRVRCACGKHIPLDASSSLAVTTCRTCHASGDRDWWVTHNAPPAPAPKTLPDLFDWLTAQNLHLTLRQVRGWADAGHLAAVNAEDVKRGVARTYDPIVSLRVAEHLLSLPRIDRGRAA